MKRDGTKCIFKALEDKCLIECLVSTLQKKHQTYFHKFVLLLLWTILLFKCAKSFFWFSYYIPCGVWIVFVHALVACSHLYFRSLCLDELVGVCYTFAFDAFLQVSTLTMKRLTWHILWNWFDKNLDFLSLYLVFRITGQYNPLEFRKNIFNKSVLSHNYKVHFCIKDSKAQSRHLAPLDNVIRSVQK